MKPKDRSHRAVAFRWLPSNPEEWEIFTLARKEAASLWNAAMKHIKDSSRVGYSLPTSKFGWQKINLGKFPNLAGHSRQHTLFEVHESLKSYWEKRKRNSKAKPPSRKCTYRDITYTNLSAKIRGDYLLLPHGKNDTLKIKLPANAQKLPGRLMEVHLSYGKVSIICETPPDKNLPTRKVAGIDLGVNTVACVASKTKCISYSGRYLKSLIQYRNLS